MLYIFYVRIMRAGVKLETARLALQQCNGSYHLALWKVHKDILAGMSMDPFGTTVWNPRIHLRISK